MTTFMIIFTTPGLRSNDTTCKYWVECSSSHPALPLPLHLDHCLHQSTLHCAPAGHWLVLIRYSLFLRFHLEIVHQLPLVRITLLCLSPFQEAARQKSNSIHHIQRPTNQACLPSEHWGRLATASVAFPLSPQCWGRGLYCIYWQLFI